jgi:hypothetical protein
LLSTAYREHGKGESSARPWWVNGFAAFSAAADNAITRAVACVCHHARSMPAALGKYKTPPACACKGWLGR